MMQLPFDEVPIAESYIQYLNYKNAPADEIVPVYKRILEKDPEHLRAILHLLDFAVKQNSIEDVLKYCDDALSYLPDRLELYYYKGVSYNMLDRKEESIEVFLDGLEKRSNDADLELVSRLWSMIGDTYYELDKEAEAYQAYDSALVYNPNNVITLNNYAYYLALEGKQLQKALEMSSKCVQLEPENCTYIDTHAWVLFSLGRYEEARAYADKIVALNPEMGYVELHHNGDIYAKCGDIDKAVEFWTKARDAGDTGKVLSKKIKKRKYYPNAKRR
jgi:tetratricopeptide (TPR) repeat protein